MAKKIKSFNSKDGKEYVKVKEDKMKNDYEKYYKTEMTYDEFVERQPKLPIHLPKKIK